MILKKTLQFIVLFTIAILVPLKFKFSLLLDIPIILTTIYAALSLFTQPYIDLDKDNNQKQDKYSVQLIVISSIICFSSAIIEHTYFPHISSFLQKEVMYLGYFLLLFGFIYRDYGLRVLGKYFSTQVRIQDDHKLIQTGPYKFNRHPCYTGSHIGMIGNALMYPSIISLTLVLTLFTFAYYYRIKFEEKALVENFKEDYIEYRKRSWGLYPFM